MAVEFVSSVSELPIADIAVAQRLRPISEDAVASLVQAIGDVGFITRVLVRRTKGGDVLLDGAHRLEAMARLGRDAIPAIVVRCRDDEAALLETDANLVGADLTPLDLAVFLAARRRVYQEMHPETKQGAAGAAARWMQTTSMSLASTIAEARGTSVRTVERLMAAGDAVSGYVHQLRQAPKPVTLKDLQVIAKIGDAPRRYGVIEALAAGRAKSAAEAVVQLKGARPPRDAAQASLEALLKTWDRAPMAAKRSFLDEVEPEVRRILGYMGAS